jgi:hypothetical protein
MSLFYVVGFKGGKILCDYASLLKKSSVCQHQEYYSLVMDAFALFDIKGANNSEMKPIVSNAVV